MFVNSENPQGMPMFNYSYDYEENTVWDGDSSSYSGSIEGMASLTFYDFFDGEYSYSEIDEYVSEGQPGSYEYNGMGSFEIE
jgi:hypothetical protein